MHLQTASTLRTFSHPFEIRKPPEHAESRSRFTLHTVTGIHWQELHHYYGIICHPAPLTNLEFLLESAILHSQTILDFPRYYKNPVENAILNHVDQLCLTGLSAIWDGYPLIPPKQVHFTLCTLDFLSLPSDPTVTSCALEIRIAFPLFKAWAAPASFNRTDFLLCRANENGLSFLRAHLVNGVNNFYFRIALVTNDPAGPWICMITGPQAFC